MATRITMARQLARRIIVATVLCGVGGSGATVHAQQAATASPESETTGDLEALVRQLRHQERRLKQLEAELSHGASFDRISYRMLEDEVDVAQDDGEEGEDADEVAEDEDDDADSKRAERIAELEERIDELEEFAGDKTIVRSGTSKSTMKIGGRVHADAWGFDTRDDTIAGFNEDIDPQNRLGFRRLRFGVKGNIKDNMLYKIEMEFAGGNNSEFRDAYLGWSDVSVLQTVLLGNQKRPYGLDHLNSSRHNVFLERPFVIEAINQDARRLGIQSYGVSEDQAWNWRYGVFNAQNVQGLGNYVGDHLHLEIAGRLANTLWYDEVSGGRGYAHWAISGSAAEATDNATNQTRFRTRPEARSANRWINTGAISGADNYQLLGLESVVNVGAVQFVGEYQFLSVDRNGAEDTDFQGGYIQAAYFLTGEHMPWERKSGTLGRVKPFQNFWLVDTADGGRDAGWGAWQIAARYSVADFSDQDVFGGEGQSLTLGLNWLWNPNARMQFNYIAGEISNRDVGNGPEEGDYNIFGTRFMVDF